ncbi:MAG: TIGR02757 family protein [Saprospiraceae bacterium]
MQTIQLKTYLEAQIEKFNSILFIPNDPISIPHQFQLKQDIEIIGFWIAVLSWGNRKSIIQSGSRLIAFMEGSPYQFILHHQEKDRQPFESFVHRTFNGEDAFYFLEFFQNYYRTNASLETAFSKGLSVDDLHVGKALIHFRKEFIAYTNPPRRTLKHISSPESNSRCKRLLMFLRWMVRKDNKGVDFGIWETIKTAQLLMPLDVHVEKIARKLGMLQRKQSDWKAVLELSSRCTELDPNDPVKYDFALFGLGLLEKEAFS